MLTLRQYPTRVYEYMLESSAALIMMIRLLAQELSVVKVNHGTL